LSKEPNEDLKLVRFVKSQKEAWEDDKPLTRGAKLSAFLALNNLLRARLAYSKIPEPVVARVGVLRRSVPCSDVDDILLLLVLAEGQFLRHSQWLDAAPQWEAGRTCMSRANMRCVICVADSHDECTVC
jgi:hypothetical protein